MSIVINLETIEEQLSKWRASKKAGDTIPEGIWENIKNITGHYRLSTIQQRLKINRSQLVQQGILEPPVARKSDKKSTATAHAKFITVSAPQSAAPISSTVPLTIAMTHPNGSRLDIALTDTKPLGEILHAFLQRGNGC